MDQPDQPPRPNLTPRVLADKAEREARQAAALRENLRRRKEQTRARTTPPAPPPAED